MRWQARVRKTKSLWIASAVALGAFGIFATSLHTVLTKLLPERATSSTQEAGASPPSHSPNRLDLTSGWSYTLATANRSPDGVPSPPLPSPPQNLDGDWDSFNPVQNWSSTRGFQLSRKTFSGHYWLHKTFDIRYPFQTPAIVLGRLAGFYKVYLNGHPIGEVDGDGHDQVAYSVFDPSLLILTGSNTLLVEVNSLNSPYPGFAAVPEIGAFMGEFNDVRNTVATGISRQAVMTAVFYAICAGVSGSTLVFALSSAFASLSLRRARDGSIAIRKHTQLESLAPLEQKIREAHEKTARLTLATRSTLYLAAPDQAGQPWFEAISIVGEASNVRRSRPIFEDLIGTACKARRPWLIHDIGEVMSFGARSNYKSRSCIIVPLCAAPNSGSTQVYGALTLSEKKGFTAFTDEEFALALEAAHELTALLQARLSAAGKQARQA
jgi:hypothetical protein